jgi:autotransporter-associated beta strand protein
MFLNRITGKSFLLTFMFVAVAANIHAGTLIKANNVNLLNDVNSWVGGTATPGSGDIAKWDGTVTAANSVGLGAPASWNGMLLNSPGGLVTITNDSNTLTLGGAGIDMSATNNGLTLLCPVVLNASQTWTVFTNRTLIVSNVVGEISAGTGLTKTGPGTLNMYATNTYTGPTVVNSGTLTLTGGSLAAGSAVKINTGGGLSVFGSAAINGSVEIGTNTAASQNASVSGKIQGNLTIDPGSTNVTPQNAIYTTPASGFMQANFSASLSLGGYITNMGVLNLTGNGNIALGTIIGPGSDAAGNLGGIQDNNTNSKTITLGNGSAFAYYKPAGGIPGTTLQIAGNGSAYIKWFGYNDGAGMAPYTNILNGGTWTLGNIGQNNSASHYVGVCAISNSATVYVTNNNGYTHGTWIVVSNSSLTFNQPSTVLTAGHAANNFGLNLCASNGGVIYAIGNGITLAFGQSTPNSVAETNSLTIGTSGSVVITNGSGQNLYLGNSGKNAALESDIVNLNGGKLIIAGTLAAGNGVLPGTYWTNATSYSPVATTNIFNWTGGQLTARTITVSNGVVVDVITNASPFSAFVTNSAVMGGSFTSTTLTNNAGILAPGDDGIPGQTTINGNYVQTGGGIVSIDLGGTTRASTFQASPSGNYDYLQVAGAIQLGGSLKVKLVGGYTPAYTDQLNIITTSGAGNFIAGTFTNIISGGGGLGLLPVDGTTNAYFRAIINSSTNTLYLINYTNITSSSKVSYSTNITASVINGGTTLQVSWPATHLGWTLQEQTNSLDIGFSTNWSDVLGTAAVLTTNLPIVPANPAVFYRLRY